MGDPKNKTRKTCERRKKEVCLLVSLAKPNSCDGRLHRGLASVFDTEKKPSHTLHDGAREAHAWAPGKHTTTPGKPTEEEDGLVPSG